MVFMKYMKVIKTLRLKMYLTQSEFGALFGVTFGTVNRWESGKNSPRIKILRQMLPYFNKYDVSLGPAVNND